MAASIGLSLHFAPHLLSILKLFAAFRLVPCGGAKRVA
jgi:hypothetical protein